jgi:hypothetical protein
MQTLNAHTPAEAGISVAIKQFFEGKQKIKKAPSEYFNQFYIPAVVWETYLAETTKGWPNHNIMIGSDFDRGEAVATWPKTVEVIKNMENLSETDKEKFSVEIPSARSACKRIRGVTDHLFSPDSSSRHAPPPCAVSAVLGRPSLSQIDKAGSFG